MNGGAISLLLSSRLESQPRSLTQSPIIHLLRKCLLNTGYVSDPVPGVWNDSVISWTDLEK